MTNIVENLELKIKNVHIRYEDSITIPDHQFACGITIESLTAKSCDANWMPGYTTAWIKDSASFKLVELTAMSFYWDEMKDKRKFGDISPNELAQEFSSLAHQFIVSPVSAQAHLKRDRSETPLRTRSRPRLVCDLILEEVQLTLNDVSGFVASIDSCSVLNLFVSISVAIQSDGRLHPRTGRYSQVSAIQTAAAVPFCA